MRPLIKSIAVAVVLGVGSVSAYASGDVVEQRRDHMKTIGKSMGLSVKMVRGAIPYDAAKAAEAMRAMSTASEQFVKLFPEGTDLTQKPKSEAKPEIWKNMQDFVAKSNELKTASASAAAAAAQGKGAFGAAFGAVGKTCGGCHKLYRQKK